MDNEQQNTPAPQPTIGDLMALMARLVTQVNTLTEKVEAKDKSVPADLERQLTVDGAEFEQSMAQALRERQAKNEADMVDWMPRRSGHINIDGKDYTFEMGVMQRVPRVVQEEIDGRDKQDRDLQAFIDANTKSAEDISEAVRLK